MVYLDNSATTPLCQPAIDKMMQCIEHFGNPSSLHSVGFEAEKLKDEARTSIYKSLGVKKSSGDRIIFTSGGTEANNLAILGCAAAKASNRGKKIITTDSEHPSVLTPVKKLESEGFEVVYLKSVGGYIDIEEIKRNVDRNTILISVMAVNNETGAVYDVESIFKTAKKINPEITTHCDCVQGYMKIPFNPVKMNADLVTLSSHKIHGPKGSGALYISAETIKRKKITPIIIGGGQEENFRSGTENMIGICGFGGAAEYEFSSLAQNYEKISALRQYAITKLESIVRVNHPEKASPHIINFTLPRIKSETMLHYLSQNGIFVSSGSACSSNHAKDSGRVLMSFGLPKEDSDMSLRVSLSHLNTKEDIDKLCEALNCGISSLVKIINSNKSGEKL